MSQENDTLYADETSRAAEEMDFDVLEAKLENDLQEQMSGLEFLKEDRENIGNPDSLGNTVLTVVWDQFVNQIGAVAGDEFIKENRGLNLDLRKESHIQTTENFADGKIATHNSKIDYQQRYDDWQSNFVKDDQGNIVTHTTRAGKQEATLVKDARVPFDKDRPNGSTETHTDMDHTVPAAEIIRDSEANAHMSKDEQIAFANSDANLNELDSSLNRSKGDSSMNDWLDNPNSKGQKPDEIFDMSEEEKQKLREKDAEARDEYEKKKKEGEKRSVEAGKQSRKEEAFRIGGKALRAAIMGLLAELIRNVIQKFITWLRSAEKSLKSFIEQLKASIKAFVSNLKQNILTAGNTLLTTIATAIFGPIISTLKKAWIFLKQGANSLKEAIAYIKNPENRNKPVSILLIEIGKIVMAGVTAAGAIVLGEVIEKGLLSIPGFAVEIPLIGSLANILGIFLGALVSGLVGALALNLMDRAIANIERHNNTRQQIEKGNDILDKQSIITKVKSDQAEKAKQTFATDVVERHQKAAYEFHEAISEILDDNSSNVEEISNKNSNELDSLLEM